MNVWRPCTRVAFRFGFSYLGLYSLAQALGTLWPMFDVTAWTAAHIFGITAPLVYLGNSRDTNFFWVQLFDVASVATIATIAWSILDGRRPNYIALHKWFRVVMRFVLAAEMFDFGMAKVIPTQFPAPSLVTLVAPAGNLSLQSFLWTAIGASTPYQIFTGVVEVLGGLLLIAPRTTLLGATICLASMIQVFVLNMTYDVGVKILSFHLILVSLFLIAPDLPRLVKFFVEPDLFETRRANRIALAVQIAFGLLLLGGYSSIARSYWYAEGGGGSAKSPLYGIWNIEELAVDGELRPAELNDYDRRWRRVIFDDPRWIFFQRTDDSFVRYGVTIDAEQRTLALTKGRSQTWHSSFAFERPQPDQLNLDGQMDGRHIHAKLHRVEFDTFRLLNSHFRWVRPPDAE